MCWPLRHQIGALADVVAQGMRGLVGLEDGRQQADLVQPLDPLAVAFVGLGPALDLAGELRRRRDDVETGLQQREIQDVAVDAGGLQGDGGDAAVAQPRDELAQSRGVCGELTHGVGAVGRGIDTGPMAGIADVDAGGVLVLGRQGRHLGAVLGLLADALGEACGTVQVGAGRAWPGRIRGR